MWLLDHNLPRQLYEVFKKTLKLPADTVRHRGWDHLENGELVEAAVKGGFVCILTKDVRFRESAAKTLKKYPTFSIVLITLKQQKGSLYTQEFLAVWSVRSIAPEPGQLVIWP